MQLAVILLIASCQLPGQIIPAPEEAPDVKMEVEGPVALDPGVFLLAQGYQQYLRCTLKIPSGFHVYWSNPGASGSATEIMVSTPAHCTVGGTLYPRPDTFHGPEGDTYGYEDEVTFLVPITSTAVDVFDVEIKARWLACRKACYMGRATKDVQLNVVGHAQPAVDIELERVMKSIPGPLSERPGTEVKLEADRLIVTGPLGPMGMPTFIPDDIPGIVLGDPEFHQDESGFRFVLPFEYRPEDALGRDPIVSGLLLEGTERTHPAWAITMSVPASQEEEVPE